ncbi:MAG: Cof-type HAD-IIB family hydrolase [Rhizobiaceae bacterium]|nr:Cof-type HAD-IIB family hydrolase [Rhizobiaceae bacterium]
MAVPRLLVSDVDRTLLTHDYRLPQRVADALAAAREAGIQLVLATARSPRGVRPYAERLGVADLVICFNGGWSGNVSSGVQRSSQPIARGDALIAMAAAHDAGLRPMWFTSLGIHALGDDELVAREAAATGETLSVAETIDKLPGAPGKIMCVSADPSAQERFAALRSQLEDRLTVSASHPRLLEIGPLGVSKRGAAAAVAAGLGLDAQACAAAGDAENDLEMLAWAGTAVTVGNASAAVKQLARFVAPSCDEGGLADAVAWLMRGAAAPAAAQ